VSIDSVQESEEVEVMIEKFKSILTDLKTTVKLSGSAATKVGNTFEERIRSANTKLSEGETGIKEFEFRKIT
jgi:hypothetical protein